MTTPDGALSTARSTAEARLFERELPPRARAALDRGELWRVKEVLQGRIGSLPFDPELYEQFGLVLLAMRDDLAAGRYLFASGRHTKDNAPAIDLYLARYGSGGRLTLASTLPGKLRHLQHHELPPPLTARLDALDREVNSAAKSGNPRRVKTRFKDTVLSYGCAFLAFFFIACAVVGFKSIVGRIVDLFP